MKIAVVPTTFIRTNTYIVYDDITKRGFIVDPGGDADAILAKVESLGLSIEAQLLTHGHWDHTGSVKQLQDSGAKVYLAEEDLGLINKSFVPDFNPADGEVLRLAGLQIRVIRTPGHTKGGTCYLVNNTLFSGDTLFAGGVGRTDLPGGDFATLKKSICEKLFTLPPDTVVYPGHEESTTIGGEAAFGGVK